MVAVAPTIVQLWGGWTPEKRMSGRGGKYGPKYNKLCLATPDKNHQRGRETIFEVAIRNLSGIAHMFVLLQSICYMYSQFWGGWNTRHPPKLCKISHYECYICQIFCGEWKTVADRPYLLTKILRAIHPPIDGSADR